MDNDFGWGFYKNVRYLRGKNIMKNNNPQYVRNSMNAEYAVARRLLHKFFHHYFP